MNAKSCNWVYLASVPPSWPGSEPILWVQGLSLGLSPANGLGYLSFRSTRSWDLFLTYGPKYQIWPYILDPMANSPWTCTLLSGVAQEVVDTLGHLGQGFLGSSRAFSTQLLRCDNSCWWWWLWLVIIISEIPSKHHNRGLGIGTRRVIKSRAVDYS